MFFMAFPTPGIMPIRSFMEPIFLTCWIWSKKSSNPKELVAIFLGHLARRLLVELLLRALHEGNDVAHAEDAVGHALGIEDVQGLHLFAGTDELDGHLDHAADRQRRTPAGIAVEFGEDDPTVVQSIVEGLGRVDGVLARHGVDHEEGFLGLDGRVDGLDFRHQRFIHGQTARRIDE